MSDETPPINERVSVLETRMDYHDIALRDSLDRITNVADTLTVQVERTNSILERLEDKLGSTIAKVAEWDTTARTVGKIIVAMSIIIGAVWSVFTFAVDHKTDITRTTTTTTPQK